MANRQPQGQQLSSKDVEIAMRSALSGVENRMDNLSNDIQNLNQRISDIEKSKLEARVDALENVKPDLESLRDDIKERTEDEEEEIQSKYDENINELIERFVDQVQANTETLDLIKGEFDEMADLRDSMFGDLEKLDDVHNFNYRVRKLRLKDRRGPIENNFEEFLEHRRNVKSFIDSLKSDFSNREPMKLQVPVWICGTTSQENGSENTYIYTPSKVESSSSLEGNIGPTPAQPYIEHLEPMLEKIAEKIDLSQSERSIAEEESIIKPGIIDDIISKLYDLSFIDRSVKDEEGGKESLFISKLKKFVQGRRVF